MTDLSTLSFEKKPLDLVPLEELAEILTKGLKNNFDYVSVEVVDCPDLTSQPFTLARPGLNGNTKLVELGGSAYTQPLVKKKEMYDLRDVAVLVNSDPAFIIGAGGGAASDGSANREAVFNLNIEKGVVDQQSRAVKVDVSSGVKLIEEILPNSETRVVMLENLFFSNGRPGKVLKIHTKKRTGPLDFITSIRQSLVDAYPNKVVGLGGTFLLKEGKAKQDAIWAHDDDEKKYFNMSAPLINVGTLLNDDYGLDLNKQHFHSFSHHGEAGHYYIDSTPNSVEYLGYFNTCRELYCVDRPLKNVSL